jgi:hypothetical protein
VDRDPDYNSNGSTNGTAVTGSDSCIVWTMSDTNSTSGSNTSLTNLSESSARPKTLTEALGMLI